MTPKPKSPKSPSSAPADSQKKFKLELSDLFWATVGLCLMIGFTQMEAAIYLPAWDQGLKLHRHILNARLQLAGLFLTAYLGGGTAGLLSQGGYLAFGLLGWNNLRIFGSGGGINYWQEPTFGYLLGFLPAAYLAGSVAFSRPRSLENFIWSGTLALVVVHLMGMGYLVLRFWQQLPLLGSYCFKYTIALLPAHFAILCSCSLVAYSMRLLLLY